LSENMGQLFAGFRAAEPLSQPIDDDPRLPGAPQRTGALRERDPDVPGGLT
jgi:hypothetical protein